MADIDPLTGIDFATVGAVGNAPWQRINNDPDDQSHGHGQVNYEFRIAKTEVNGALYNEFLTVAFNRPQSEWIPFLGNNPTVNGSGNHMVGGVTWREAAILCNWLCNGKGTNREAFLTGAYDVSSFFGGSGFGFPDQRTHTPGAAYYIPTWDEWMKATHYDPNKINGDGSVGGWWQYANMRDTPLVYGPPPAFGGNGTGMANAGFSLPGFAEVNIPVGSYPTQVSPWGLLDTAGGMREWMEDGLINSQDEMQGRLSDGSGWGSSPATARAGDYAGYASAERPDIGWSDYGIRIAAAVPAPGGAGLVVACLAACVRRRR